MLFPPDFLTRLEYLSIMSKRVFRGQLLAQRRTRQTGAGIEFADHREYSPGEDLRYLDWNVYARHGDLLIRRFQEEQDLHLWLLLDCSNSMNLADGRKFDLARQLAAALAWIALADLDRISVLACAAGVVEQFPLTRGRERILPLMQFLQGLTASTPQTSLLESVRQFLHRRPRPGIAVILSDLFDPAGFEAGLDQLRFSGFDLHVIQLHHPLDADPAVLGDAELVDVETGTTLQTTITEHMLSEYRRLFRQHQDAVRNYCARYNLGCTQSGCQVQFDSLVMAMMKQSATS
ncbi:MAG: DUF58 domain-containing protein [Planctomyces sp.]|jgi:uncharacterized protein (DUF58 family)|nr:DUF58 domain-containing protein [Planctomycetaceae bacterium]HBC61430.1 DUF58 domain-containing protein [Planctomycetaceae bacterium]